jgi:hypothetical protein
MVLSGLFGIYIGVNIERSNLEKELSKKHKVIRAPFGYYKTFELKVKGHPLSELSREIGNKDNIIVDTLWPNMVSLLPIKLKSFNSAYKNNSVILNWQSMYENNFDFYQLEKSIDANQFTTVATIKGKSINGNAADYSFTDASIVKDKQYYRLKMVNRDGSFNYSQVITSSSKSSLEISLYPNPVNNLLVVTHQQLSETVTLQIFNQEGKLVKSATTQKGTAQTTIDVESLNKGAYALYFLVNGNSSVLKFVK